MVQLGVHAGANHTAVGEAEWRVIHQGCGDMGGDIDQRIPLVAKRRQPLTAEVLQVVVKAWQQFEGFA